jgi:hypothetical protein
VEKILQRLAHDAQHRGVVINNQHPPGSSFWHGARLARKQNAIQALVFKNEHAAK